MATTERQYRQSLENGLAGRAPGQPVSLAVREELRRAASRARRWRAAVDAWAKVAPPELLGATRVEALANGILVVSVQHPLCLHELSRRAAGLRRRLGEFLPGARGLRLRLCPSADPASGGLGDGGG